MTDQPTAVAPPSAPEAPPAKPEPVAVASPATEEETKKENGDNAAVPPKTADVDADAAAPVTAPTTQEENAEAEDNGVAAKNPAPSDDILTHRLRELLKVTDLQATSVRQLRAKLEQEFNCDLGEKKALVRETIDAYLIANKPKEEEQGASTSSSSDEEDDEDHASKKARSTAGAVPSSSAQENEEEGEEEEERPRKAKAKAKGKGKSGGGGFQKPLKLSSAMSEFCGGEEKLSRAQIVKKCWDYIKAHELQDPSDRRKIMVKGELEKIFTPPITMFSMNKQISKHVFPDDD